MRVDPNARLGTFSERGVALSAIRVRRVPRLEAEAAEIHDPIEILERMAYRNARMLDRLGDKDDPVGFVLELAGHNRTDIRRLAELLGHDISNLIA
jgi:hypothetical protein